MLQEEPEEILAFERSVAGFSDAGFHILKGDVAVLAGDDIVFRKDTAVQIAGQEAE